MPESEIVNKVHKFMNIPPFAELVYELQSKYELSMNIHQFLWTILWTILKAHTQHVMHQYTHSAIQAEWVHYVQSENSISCAAFGGSWAPGSNNHNSGRLSTVV